MHAGQTNRIVIFLFEKLPAIILSRDIDIITLSRDIDIDIGFLYPHKQVNIDIYGSDGKALI
jgi:hypothetical protein